MSSSSSKLECAHDIIFSEKWQSTCGPGFRKNRLEKKTKLENQNTKHSSVSTLGFPNFLQETLQRGEGRRALVDINSWSKNQRAEWFPLYSLSALRFFPLKKQTARGVFKTAASALSTETELGLEMAEMQVQQLPSYVPRPPVDAWNCR